VGCWTTAELFHDTGNGLTIVAGLDPAERAVADFQDFGLIAFRTLFTARQCGEDEELWRGTVAFPILGFTHQVAVTVQSCGADDHDAGQGVRLAKRLAAGFDQGTVLDQSAQELSQLAAVMELKGQEGA